MIWIKVLHVVFMVSWFAGLFYLPRLFVYHAESKSKDVSETLKVMERRLYRGIMTPAMLLTFASGLWMTIDYAWQTYQGSQWLHVKITAALLLIGYHHMLGAWMKKFQKDTNKYSGKFYRIINEVPLLFLIGILVLVLVKPF